jgi:hypothetical protein
MEMSSIEDSDHSAASSCPTSSDPSAPASESVAQADSIDFYSPNRLPVDVSFMEFDPQTPPSVILLQFQRLNLLYVHPLKLSVAPPISHPSTSQLRRCVRQRTVLRHHNARGSRQAVWFIHDLKVESIINTKHRGGDQSPHRTPTLDTLIQLIESLLEHEMLRYTELVCHTTAKLGSAADMAMKEIDMKFDFPQ